MSKESLSWLNKNWFKLALVGLALLVVLQIGRTWGPDNLEEAPITEAVLALNPITSSTIELTENRSYLFSKDFDPNKVSVYGIKIGDPESKIPVSTITERLPEVDWIHTSNDVGYRVYDGKVVEIVLHTDELKKGGLAREEEIYIRFGVPDKEESYEGFIDGTRYYYLNRGLIVSYIDAPSGNDIMGVNILPK